MRSVLIIKSVQDLLLWGQFIVNWIPILTINTRSKVILTSSHVKALVLIGWSSYYWFNIVIICIKSVFWIFNLFLNRSLKIIIEVIRVHTRTSIWLNISLTTWFTLFSKLFPYSIGTHSLFKYIIILTLHRVHWSHTMKIIVILKLTVSAVFSEEYTISVVY